MIHKLLVRLRNNESELPKLASVFVDQVLMSITTFATTIILARTYSKTSYADLVLLFSLTLFILGFQSALISKPYAINLVDYKLDERKAFFEFNIAGKFWFTLLIILITPLLYLLLFKDWDTSNIAHYLLYIVAYTFYYFVRETLLSERRTKANMYYGVACSFSLLTLLAIIYFQQIESIYFYLIMASSIYLAISFVYVLLNVKHFNFFRSINVSYFKSNWKVGKWLVGSNFLFHMSSSIYPWLLLFITTKEDVAVLGVLMGVALIVNPLLTALNSYLLPVFVSRSKDMEKIKANVTQWTYVFGFIALMLLIVGYFFGNELIVLLFGEKYDNLGILVIYPFIIQAINVFFQPFKLALDAIKRTDVNFWILIPRSIIAIGLGYILISKYGLVGAFYTMIIENLIYRALNFYLYKKISSNTIKTAQSNE